jgi:hypothetical protein
MSFPMEYHMFVRYSIPASVALFSLLVVPVILVSNGHAQINGTPSSVTSPGFGGRPINAPSASVTSPGPRGFAPNSRDTFSASRGSRDDDGHRHHHHGDYAPPLVYAVPVPVPYAADIGATDDDADPSADQNDQGGPTILDRRGSGAASYIPPERPERNVPKPHSTETANASVADPEPDPPQEPILLVFKDGRKLEVGNYAILGKTLFDLTPGHARKVALADLDLEATRQQNDDRGITFQVPPSSHAN